ncbi:hypothetical protein LJB90_00475 [Eubacteriales bacterium OttesenSCG-928-G02]|nr:hypothetical protein [Eubacteriales bacterium OttesenSCG-928-G02]
MKEDIKVIELDRSEQGVILTALSDFRNKRLEEGKTADIASDLINEIFEAPTKKVKVRDAAR